MRKYFSKGILISISLLLFVFLLAGCFPPIPDENEAPVIASSPITTATVDELYTYNVEAIDPDGEDLTYSLTVSPTGMTINSDTGEITWTPDSTQIGDHDVTVVVSDGSKQDTQSFTITVFDILQSITVLPATMPLWSSPVNPDTKLRQFC